MLLLAAACFHATVQTGATPGSTTISKPWASSWVFGLVPPKTVETASQCPAGVATVETQHSFLNMLVTVLTLDIYTPMTITVTCAEGRHADATSGAPDLLVAESQGTDAIVSTFATAADRAAADGKPVLVEVRNGR
jgi:Bor protein